ncbi:MAG TPA: helix-hairpin-helix domain-containing protein, partial [Humisphaera sp.]
GPRPRARRGTILVAAMWASIIIAAIVLVTARVIKVDAQATNNRASDAVAVAVEHGAEQYVLSLVEAAKGDPTYVTGAPAESMYVGDRSLRSGGYFWIIRPDPADQREMIFGVVDEASKVSLNAASVEELSKLPGMTADVAAAIVDWRDPDETVTGQGAESSTYNRLKVPYNAKNAPFETVDELRLVIEPKFDQDKVRTNELLYGYDTNRDGVLDVFEQQGGGLATGFSAGQGAGVGIAPFVTAYSRETAARAAGGNAGPADVNGDPGAVTQALVRAKIPQSRATDIVTIARNSRVVTGNAQRFSSVFDFCYAGTMRPDEVKLAYDQLAYAAAAAPGGGPGAAFRGRYIVGRMNVNTAPREALATLPGLDTSDADKLVSARSGQAAGGSVAWVYEAIGPEKAAKVGNRLTNKSYQYSADIVAVTADGRSFRRVRVVVDGRTTPAKIIYRRDMTEFGWPLEPSIRDHLRSGGELETPIGGGGGSSSGLGSGSMGDGGF